MSGPFAFRMPDGDLNLEEALGDHLRHYVGLIIAGAGGTRVLAPPARVPAGELVRQGHGQPTRASSSGEVALRPGFSWDACAYYLRLGVGWRASKRELRLAYLHLDPAQQDERLYYCLTQLLDDRVRRAYDATPLGGVFLWDRDIAAEIKRAAAREAARRMAAGDEATADDVMEEMGFRTVPKEEPREEDDSPADEEDDEEPRELSEAPVTLWGARWGHYVLAGDNGVPQADAVLLEAWQGLVAAALREQGIVTRFAVAQGSETSPMVLRNINEPCIFILTEKRVSPEKASEAVVMGISLGIVTDNSQQEAVNASVRR